jgi:hypothetical protein
VRKTDVLQPPTDNPAVRAYHIILLGQALAVIASVTGFIGISMAYKALTRGANRSVTPPIEPPTIE